MSAWFGDDAPLSGSFLPVPVEVVDHVLTLQPKDGPWPRWAACLDLRRWQDRALGRRVAFPSRRQLADRWGWDGKDGRPGEGAVRGLLVAELEWADPRKAEAWARHPASAAGLKAAREAKTAAANAAMGAKDPDVQPTGNPGGAHRQPTGNPPGTGEPVKCERRQPTGNPPATQGGPTRRHTRVDHNAPLTSHDQEPSPQPPAPRGAPDHVVDAVVRSLLRLPQLTASRDAEFRRRLESGTDRELCKWLWERMEKANELPTRARKAQLGDAAVIAVRLWVERRGWEPLPDDAVDERPTREPEPARAPDPFLEPLLRDLCETIRPEDVDIWLRDSRGAMDGTTLRITVWNEYYAEWIRDYYAGNIAESARRVYGAEDVTIEVEA